MENIYDLKIFNWLEKKIVDCIINNSKIETFFPWEKIISEWEESNWKWYIIKSWEVMVKIWEKKIAKLWIWEIFWEIALLSEEQRIATVLAITNIKTIILTQEDLIEMVNNWNVMINKKIIKRLEENLTN